MRRPHERQMSSRVDWQIMHMPLVVGALHLLHLNIMGEDVGDLS